MTYDPLLETASEQTIHVPALTFSVSAEKNSRGWTWKIGVQNAPDLETALAKLDQLRDGMEARYGRE